MVSVISEWVRCPICGNKTRLQIRADTELKVCDNNLTHAGYGALCVENSLPI